MPDFSLVELPANLPAGALDRLADTRISGQLIELRPDSGRPQRRKDATGGSYRDNRGSGDRYGDRSQSRGSYGDDRPARKPRHKRSDG